MLFQPKRRGALFLRPSASVRKPGHFFDAPKHCGQSCPEKLRRNPPTPRPPPWGRVRSRGLGKPFAIRGGWLTAAPETPPRLRRGCISGSAADAPHSHKQREKSKPHQEKQRQIRRQKLRASKPAHLWLTPKLGCGTSEARQTGIVQHCPGSRANRSGSSAPHWVAGFFRPPRGAHLPAAQSSTHPPLFGRRGAAHHTSGWVSAAHPVH